MKKIITYFFVLFISLINAQSLTGIFVLRRTAAVGDSKELSKNFQIPDFYLYSYSNNKSLLEKISKGGTKIDTIKKTLEEYNFKYETIATDIKPTKVLYYKDLQNKLYENLRVANKKEFFIKDNLPVINWTITKETKTIEGYLCTKATADRTVVGYPLKVIAWFCEKLPISDGPFDYSGLPGFILEFSYDGLSTTTFTNLKYNAKQKIEISPLTSSVKPMTMREYEKSYK